MAHGDCLMQAVRAVFNLAIGAEAADIKNTARSALLQMVNTVLKRVGQQILVGAAGRRQRWALALAEAEQVLAGGADGLPGLTVSSTAARGVGQQTCGRCRQCCCALLRSHLATGKLLPFSMVCFEAAIALAPACLQSPNGTPLPSPAATYFRPLHAGSTGSASTENVTNAAANAAPSTASADQAGGGDGSSAVGGSSKGAPSAPSSVQGGPAGPGSTASIGGGGLSQAPSDADLPAQQHPSGSPKQPLSPAESGRLMQALSAEMSIDAPAGSGEADGRQGGEPLRLAPPAPLALPPGIAASPPGSSAATSPAAGQLAGLGSAPSTDMAEAADAAAVAADIAELQAALPRIQTSPPTPTHGGGAEEATAEQFVAAAVQADARTAQLASLAEQSDLRGLERALDSLPQAEPTPGSLPKLTRQDTPPDPRRCACRRECCWAPHMLAGWPQVSPRWKVVVLCWGQLGILLQGQAWRDSDMAVNSAGSSLDLQGADARPARGCLEAAHRRGEGRPDCPDRHVQGTSPRRVPPASPAAWFPLARRAQFLSMLAVPHLGAGPSPG